MTMTSELRNARRLAFTASVLWLLIAGLFGMLYASVVNRVGYVEPIRMAYFVGIPLVISAANLGAAWLSKRYSDRDWLTWLCAGLALYSMFGSLGYCIMSGGV
jgi:amino acid transporter